jgi:hypothetical protein
MKFLTEYKLFESIDMYQEIEDKVLLTRLLINNAIMFSDRSKKELVDLFTKNGYTCHFTLDTYKAHVSEYMIISNNVNNSYYRIDELEDSYFILAIVLEGSTGWGLKPPIHYKCDQLDGLKACIKDKLDIE